MDRVPGSKGVSTQVPKISDWKDDDMYPNWKLSCTQCRVFNNFDSGFWLSNNPIITNFLLCFLPNNCGVIFLGSFCW